MRRPQFLCRPQPSYEQLLDVLFLEDRLARQRWSDWRSSKDIEHFESGMYELLPSLYRRLSYLVPDEPWLPRMKSVYKRTWTKNATLYHNSRLVTELFKSNGIESMLLKGMGLLPYYNSEPGLRIMGDVDLLVRPEHTESAVELLMNHDWRPDPACNSRYLAGKIVPEYHSWAFQHNHTKIDLHWSPIHREFGEFGTEQLWNDAVEARLFGDPVRVPIARDALLLALIHGVRPQNNRRVLWVLDAIKILRHGLDPAQQFEFSELVARRRFTALVRDTLGYIEWRYGIQVPLDTSRRYHAVGSVLQRFEYKGVINQKLRGSFAVRGARLLTSSARNFNGAPANQRVNRVVRPILKKVRDRSIDQIHGIQRLLNRNDELAPLLRRSSLGIQLPPVPDWPVAELRPGDTVEFSERGRGYCYAISGWALQEEKHLWSSEHQARLVFALNESVRGHVNLQLRFTPYIPSTRYAARIELNINSQWYDRLTFSRPSMPEHHGIFIDTSTLNAEGIVDVVLTSLHPRIPAREEKSSDPRLLGLCLTSMTVESMPSWDMVAEINIERGNPAVRYLGTGWWAAEENGVWTSMPRSHARIPILNGHELETISFHVTPCLPEQEKNSLRISVSGRFTGQIQIELEHGSPQLVTVGLQDEQRRRGIKYLDLTFATKRLYIPNAEDRRHLGFMLHTITATGELVEAKTDTMRD